MAATYRPAIVAGLLILLSKTFVFADDSEGVFAPADVQTDEVVVSASRFEDASANQAIGVQVITGEQIRNAGVRTLPEILSRSAGIYTRDNTGSPNQQIDLRGFGITGDQNTLVLVDGQRITENDLTPADLASIPLSSIERVEILRSSGSVLYGRGASGGTINIITRGARPDSRNGTISAGYGSYNASEVMAAATLGSERAGIAINANQFESDNYRENNDLKQRNLQSDFRVFGRNGPIYLKVGVADQELRLPGSRTEEELVSDRRGTDTPNDFSSLRTLRANLGTNLTFDAAEVAVDLTYRDKDSDSINQVGSQFGSIAIEGSDTTFSPRLRIPFSFGVNHELVTGIDWDEWEYRTTSVFPPFAPSALTSHQTNTAFFLKDSVLLAPSTRLTVGARAHRTDTTIEDTGAGGPARVQKRNIEAWEFALRQGQRDALSVHFKTGRSFRVANVDENRFVAEPLEPQTSNDTEIGIDLERQVGGFRAAVYRMDISNEIAFLPGDVFPPFGNNVNLPPTLREGVEIEAHWNSASWLTVSGRYTYTVAQFREGSFGGADVTGKNIPLIPRHQAGLSITVSPQNRLRISGNIAYVGEQYYDNDQSNTFGRQIPEYVVTDLSAAYRIERWFLQATVNNLFNEHYFTYGISSSSAPTFNAYPAAERSVFVTAQYDF